MPNKTLNVQRSIEHAVIDKCCLHQHNFLVKKNSAAEFSVLIDKLPLANFKPIFLSSESQQRFHFKCCLFQ